MEPRFILLLFILFFLISCNGKNNETATIKSHHFSAADTTFLFPDLYRRKNYTEYDFEENSKWLNNFSEQRLFDSSGYPNYIRLLYGRAFDNGIIVLIDADKIVVKEEDWPENGYSIFLDSSLLSVDQKKWLNNHQYYRWLKKHHMVDSAKTIMFLLKNVPDIEDEQKNSFLKFKAERFTADSLIYTEMIKPSDQAFIEKLFQKIDSADFFSFKNSYFESTHDGSGFLLEVKNGNSYHCVYCSNCVVKELIYLRDEILKVTNLKKDEIY